MRTVRGILIAALAAITIVEPISVAFAVPERIQVYSPLPPPVRKALARVGISPTAVAAYVREIGVKKPLLSYRAHALMNPASTMKLVTTYAALDLLGADYTWQTGLYTDGVIHGGSLDGNLYLKGAGDPKITYEAFTSLLQKLRNLGIRDIHGDIVQDRSLFATFDEDPSAFDKEPFMPYNVGPDALLVDFKAIRFVFTPDPDHGKVLVRAEPHPPNLDLTNSLVLTKEPCGDWRTGMDGRFNSRDQHAGAWFLGRYSANCGEREWYVSLLDHASYVDGTFRQVWSDLGGRSAGALREGRVPKSARLLVAQTSPPLGDMVQDINKFSNNVMARELFLSLAPINNQSPVDMAAAVQRVKDWAKGKGLKASELVLENGSGLSRKERISAENLARVLELAYGASFRTAYVGSLPLAGVDGTMKARLRGSPASGFSYLKTGSLDDVRALAGYLFGPNGRCFILVAFVNHRNALDAIEALDALVPWAYQRSGMAAGH